MGSTASFRASVSGAYTIKVLPVRNGVTGNPIYRTLTINVKSFSVACSDAASSLDPIPAITNMTCSVKQRELGYALFEFSWVSTAPSYRVSVTRTDGWFGADEIVAGNTVTVYVPWTAAGSDGTYSVRVQGVDGDQAGQSASRTIEYKWLRSGECR